MYYPSLWIKPQGGKNDTEDGEDSVEETGKIILYSKMKSKEWVEAFGLK